MVTGSLLPLLGLFFPGKRLTPMVGDSPGQGVSSIVLWVTVAAVVLAVLMELARFSFPSFNRSLMKSMGVLFKEEEQHRVTGATYLLIATLAAFLLFDRSVAVIALLFLSLGDPLAAMVGSRYGRLRLGAKTLEGSVSFLILALLIGVAFSLTDQADPFWPLAVGAAVAAFVELLPLPADDNLLTPLFSGAVMAALL